MTWAKEKPGHSPDYFFSAFEDDFSSFALQALVVHLDSLSLLSSFFFIIVIFFKGLIKIICSSSIRPCN